MELFYPVSCAIAFVICAVLGFITRPKSDGNDDSDSFRKFQAKYLLAWAIAVCADWLQGPYVYALHEAYGYTREENAHLFVVGFGASFLFGTFVAGFADTVGRKRAVLLYCFMYAAACSLKHVNDYNALMLARVCGGIATSILFSAFESWLVYEHCTRYNFSSKQLSYNFSMMYFVNYLVACCTGLVGDSFVASMEMKPVFGNVHFGGFLMPFFLAIVAMIVTAIYVSFNWEENYGDSQSVMDQVKNFGRGAYMICTNAKMARCCAVVSLFESAMFIFVFNWTPVLHQGAEVPPFGMIFSTFMMSCMIGASIFSLCSKYNANTVLGFALAVASAAMLVPAYIGMSDALTKYNLWAFLVFELTVGIYFPAICTLKSEAVPESNRSTIYNLFRMPMNAIVCIVLLINPDLVPTFKFVFCNLAIAGVIMAVELLSPSVQTSKGEGAPLMQAAKEV